MVITPRATPSLARQWNTCAFEDWPFSILCPREQNVAWHVRQWFHCCFGFASTNRCILCEFCHSEPPLLWTLITITTALSPKHRLLSSCLPAGTPTIVRHVTADHDSSIVCHPSSDHPQNEVQHPNNSDDNKDNNSCSHSQRLFILLDVKTPILYARSDSFLYYACEEY